MEGNALIEYRLAELEKQFVEASRGITQTLAGHAEKLEVVHRKLIELEMKLQSPGTGATCMAQNAALAAITSRLESMDSRLRTVDEARLLRVEGRLATVETKVWVWAGGLAVAMALVSIFGPTLRHALHLTP